MHRRNIGIGERRRRRLTGEMTGPTIAAMTMEIVPLSPTMGAEIRGVDLSRPLDPAVASALRAAWLDHVLLVFRGQTLDDDALRRSADWLGEAADISMPVDRRGDEDTSIALISNIRDETGVPTGALGDGDMWFHHDNSYTEAPDKATWLYAVELPSRGGNTLFGNCYRAYEALPERLRRSLAGRKVLQVYDYTLKERPDIADLDGVPQFWQPAVIVHPLTRKRALYVDRLMTAAVGGYDRAASESLIEEVCEYIEQVDYEHVWRRGDYVIWDNRCSVHARSDFPARERRLLKRGKVAGEPLLADIPTPAGAH